ncbi:hypothetical protein RRG08_021647 [Elysia crispata]|uniref:Uncharacterized protein n=1 Tax=Elysia crispata TaxID=231223 RepID=A0AAE0XE15_9GAST|nr:hypothetical protein RRG08_021647 [Elysia crispata]
MYSTGQCSNPPLFPIMSLSVQHDPAATLAAVSSSQARQYLLSLQRKLNRFDFIPPVSPIRVSRKWAPFDAGCWLNGA